MIKLGFVLFPALIALKITAKCRFFRNWSKGGIPLKTRNPHVFPQHLVYFYLKDLVNHVTDCVSIFMLAVRKFRGRFAYPHKEECNFSSLARGGLFRFTLVSFWLESSLAALIFQMMECSRLISKTHRRSHCFHFVCNIMSFLLYSDSITRYFYRIDICLNSFLEQGGEWTIDENQLAGGLVFEWVRLSLPETSPRTLSLQDHSTARSWPEAGGEVNWCWCF